MTAVDINLRTGFEGAVHLPGSESAKLVTTSQIRQAAYGLNSLVKHGGVIVLDGEPGLGKTAATKVIGRKLNMEKRLLAMPNRPKGKETTARISASLTGQRPSMRLTEYELLEDIVDVLDGQQVALSIDEAQHLTRESFRQLRWLQDHDRTQLLLMFVGVNVVHELRLRCPELLNRVRRIIKFQPYDKATMTSYLQEYHPLYANTEAAVYALLLKAINGNLRNAANLLAAALDLGIDPDDGFTSQNAKAVIRAVQGGR